ncbi:hypothetical protein [Prescottella agglutinans]
MSEPDDRARHVGESVEDRRFRERRLAELSRDVADKSAELNRRLARGPQD